VRRALRTTRLSNSDEAAVYQNIREILGARGGPSTTPSGPKGGGPAKGGKGK
jgi:hypothetical protein